MCNVPLESFLLDGENVVSFFLEPIIFLDLLRVSQTKFLVVLHSNQRTIPFTPPRTNSHKKTR